jgi:Fe-S cluster assembly protein SufD
MTATRANPWLESLLAGHDTLAQPGISWVNELRRAALERSHALALPGRSDEAWRFTDLSALYRMAFQVPAASRAFTEGAIGTPALSGSILPSGLEIPEAACRLTFVDGVLDPSLSTPCDQAGIRVVSLASVLADATHPLHTRVQGFLDGGASDRKADVLASLNLAFLQHGALVVLERGLRLDAPVHLLLVSSRPDLATHPRVLVLLEQSAEAHLVEEHVALHGGPGCVNAVTRIRLGAGASLRHARVQRDSSAGFHMAQCVVDLARDARYESTSIALGARLSRLDLDVHLRGEGAHASLDGLAMIGAGQLADTHTFIDHASPHCTSQQLHKVVLAGNAHGVFNGRILVQAGAQQTDSAQQSRTLILSDRARIDAKPQLEIFADDVKCAHGATVGQLEADELFYLVSRGIEPAAARRLLTFGFAADVINRLGIASLEQRLREHVLAQTGSLKAGA